MPFEGYTVGCYLLDRLVEAGCDHLFGVPGDFNLRFLDDVMAHPTMKWVGTANELNAGYAADGYARLRGLGAITTTCGVGELSALNGVAGSAAESVPVIHIAGATSTKSQSNRELLHHTLGDGNHNHFLHISAEVCCVAVMLTPENCLTEIDRVVTEVLYRKKPGYIALPMNLAEMTVKPPAAKLVRREPECSPDAVEAFKLAVTSRLGSARNPAVLVGHLVHRFRLSKQVDQLLENVRIPFAPATLGKGAVSEHLENYVGTYLAGDKPCPAKSVVESADVCISIGVELVDCVTSLFRQKIDPLNTIDIQPFFAKVGDQIFHQVPMEVAVRVVEEAALEFHSNWSTEYPQAEEFIRPDSNTTLDLAHVWNEIQAGLRPNDIVVVDLGTSAFSSVLLRLPEGADYFCQHLWASIGYSLPAALGAQVAEPNRRVVCIVGDGAAQMTVQELGLSARYNLHPTYLLINNDGYTIERYIRGWDSSYNDVASWEWTGLARNLCKGNEPRTRVIDSVGGVLDALNEKNDKMLFAEVLIGKFDGPLRSAVPLPGKPANLK
ncbi:putative pyruvate/indole-pyruvate carboxylase [Leptomonas pyrrhocoris]|uniref:Putative pyruvate/indole-pyruvate carboxylase n=1 Tax=Leptomonas pyrrhocoris TaxID=157538 RepID=A0A0N0DX15_LEPPY|nr:putative pyruvate/indole-pyruvate carboxylase [Leptomonas pyrrhocoris]XP_015660851.1 putative pyruvate/indole-pyruvate carboxylase [Leptomonas pyrrhocoris]KPA82411.1 putative pyruvate/indole-pyruvate carboxylase [Leptomonas pyrrhocoris]KPA82412.1 putative pyruvate/indole-pyruvate carboxylase [Leptomonas pyrrhocoris]|eukprot:XP_015660850.1 putative pyruvate/indole-pyruvate carboxylase [Leptomonas pyrrhocoris]